ncbi:glycoside hydrolase domain-containing protein [Niabella aurantiaca]|uniref:glycoside hydrolase domain-containing protein n=1 Tax=Niabella aurantiaca TaxID=379900 RepID=UPI000475D576|nr:glycoside hydrolase domain-containing protein [Niabella aurantiaca]
MKYVLSALSMLVFHMLHAQQIKYTSGAGHWDTDSLGDHRAVVQFNGSGKVAKTVVEWRRRDPDPEAKRIIVQDARTGEKISNVKVASVNNEKGVILFEPVSGKGKYYLYYLVSKNSGSPNYPTVSYLKPEQTAGAAWLNAVPASLSVNAPVVAMESSDAFNSFYPMEITATAEETAALVKKYGRTDYIVFPEDRKYPVKMFAQLPYRWIRRGVVTDFKGNGMRGENYSFQLAVYALRDLGNISVLFSDLKDGKDHVIPASGMSCINTGGIDYTGKPFSKQVPVAKDSLQPLWCLVDIPADARPGIYKGRVTVNIAGAGKTTVPVQLTVAAALAEEGNIGEPWNQTRLKWLNSTMAQENTVIAPYTPLVLKNNAIDLLGRRVTVAPSGFPAQLQTFFTEEMTGLKTEPNNILTEQIHFHFTGADGKELKFENGNLQYTNQSAGTVVWKTTSRSPLVQMDVAASLEFDGFLSYTVKVTALQDADFKNITLHIPFTPEAATYLMGLGEKGRARPDSLSWKWDVAHKNQDGVWVGAVNAGLQYTLRDERYVRPLNTNFYLQKPLLLPASWGNGQKGGITIAQKGKSILADNYTGPRHLKKGDTLYFNFNLLLTPFHPLNTDFQWATRFYHRYDSISKIKSTGATVINIHHGNAINPWINYPFIEWQKMKNYIDQAHQDGLKVKIYNTVRELSNHAYELFPLRSLGHEVYSPGKGGGFRWLQEHIGSDYIAAWFVPAVKDAAIINSGMSRWHNYYVEGMNWLTKKVGIDGIYLDDVAFDRITMKRIKRVLTAKGHPGIIDLHSANQYNKSDGFINSANLYMEHFPYLNRLWFGEYFDYEHNSPDFFLTEVSGIPFGLMGEMLQDGGNAWRGMIYGMTCRIPWTANADPTGIWKLWDDFGMEGSRMIGYWVSTNPVKTDNDKIKATVYKKEGKALVSIASRNETDTEVTLNINWEQLGIDPAKATITAPAVKNFQEARSFKVGDKIPVPKNKGWMLLIQ